MGLRPRQFAMRRQQLCHCMLDKLESGLHYQVKNVYNIEEPHSSEHCSGRKKCKASTALCLEVRLAQNITHGGTKWSAGLRNYLNQFKLEQ